jgi:hypothetical protein
MIAMSYLRPVPDECPSPAEDPHEVALTASGAPLLSSAVEVALLSGGLHAAARVGEAIAKEAGATAREAIKAKTERQRLDHQDSPEHEQAPDRQRSA